MFLSSPEFENNEYIPPEYTCDGDNVSPPLEIHDVPEGTKSLALIMDDPDAPSGDWVHWTIWNIPPETKEIDSSKLPMGAVCGMTDSGFSRYGGPCPPSGEHRYFFKLYALDTMLDLDENATKQDLLKAIEGHIIGQTELVGLYTRV